MHMRVRSYVWSAKPRHEQLPLKLLGLQFMSGLTDTLETVRSATQSGYKWGFETDIEMELAPKGLDETTSA